MQLEGQHPEEGTNNPWCSKYDAGKVAESAEVSHNKYEQGRVCPLESILIDNELGKKEKGKKRVRVERGKEEEKKRKNSSPERPNQGGGGYKRE